MKIYVNHGFTLLELAIVLVIVSLLAGGMMMTLAPQIDLRDRRETQVRLQNAHDALIGYAAAQAKPRLPCPDVTGDGEEDVKDDGSCSEHFGVLPWGDLGVVGQDVWGNRLSYQVAPAFSNKNGFSLGSTASIKICSEVACTSPQVAVKVPAVILSHGKNGYGAMNLTGSFNTAPINTQELENINGDDTFVLREPKGSSGISGFDDHLIWVSSNILFNRMITAGRLP